MKVKVVEYTYRELEIATESFSINRLIGKGSHGSVYKGVLLDGTTVAIKKISNGLQTLQDQTKLENEIVVLSSLNRSSFFVNLLGFARARDNDHLLVVTDFMPNGTLHQMLHSSAAPILPPRWYRRTNTAFQVAKAIAALHDISVIHRDIKSANILLDDRHRARLADFGLAVRGPGSTAAPAGTIGYLDPSYTAPSKLSTKTDVYSFGVVLLELLSGRQAVDVDHEPPMVAEWATLLVDEGRVAEVWDRRLGPPAAAVWALMAVAVRCVDKAEERRPCMKEVVRELKGVVHRARFPVWGLIAGCFLQSPGDRTRRIVCREHHTVEAEREHLIQGAEAPD
ncbi:hypothetical protein AMTRI_Chr11g97730 [Amborella trichopoda]|uniref:Protein kinase domain-containing protein n=1 Tax=Amborella trichopoda TaxID=13333 RepID=U5DDM7_AMBTC|nr:serine/threonine-protein kinase-like protein At3g51990 [Amborella trichopoda]ERN20654.1 hypothetical protein AMTR_s00070p00160180 [Amborella trichopoda]|eukprot:XP_006859187.1 serine/threonine-protein kinase-like protein At3g51990 [Amborella trichopoda]